MSRHPLVVKCCAMALEKTQYHLEHKILKDDDGKSSLEMPLLPFPVQMSLPNGCCTTNHTVMCDAHWTKRPNLVFCLFFKLTLYALSNILLKQFLCQGNRHSLCGCWAFSFLLVWKQIGTSVKMERGFLCLCPDPCVRKGTGGKPQSWLWTLRLTRYRIPCGLFIDFTHIYAE